MEERIPRPEYPRPQMVREEWINLNGSWQFAFDEEDRGLREEWFLQGTLPLTIQVPFACETVLSGINQRRLSRIVWYKKRIPSGALDKGKRYLLHFGAVDYKAQVWVNGSYMGSHKGGHSPFTFEITPALTQEHTTITVRAEDEPENLELPRGKQFWKEEPEFIFYPGVTGIWQTVWLEPVRENYIKKFYFTPDIDRKMIEIEWILDKGEEYRLEAEISLGGVPLIRDSLMVSKRKAVRGFYLDQNQHLRWEHKEYEWTPENPVLFDVRFRLFSMDGQQLDQVESYFAMRKVSVENGRFLLNNRPYYQKMVLDQGYWRESLLTAPADQAFATDIRLCKEMGFNGARKHQKAEDPRYYYWADRLGFLVWGECANSYVYSRNYVKNFVPEWMDIVDRDYNHPCIVAWVPLNESWGVGEIMTDKMQQAHSKGMYYLTKSLDDTRLVISNDGWNHTKSDLLTIHDYEGDKDTLTKRYSTLDNLLPSMPANRTLYAHGHCYEGEPVIVSEFGGISFQTGKDAGWGYTSAQDPRTFEKQYQAVISAMLESPLVQGFVYTQICDVEQEINGLLTYDREPKLPLETIRRINQGAAT